MPVYIYILVDGRNNKPFYVGSTDSLPTERLKSHLLDATKNNLPKTQLHTIKKRKLINEILATGHKVLSITLMQCNAREAVFFEKMIFNILTYGKENLLQCKGKFIRNS